MLNYSILPTFRMSHAKSVEATRDELPDLEARIIKAIGIAGPRNVAQISRMTGAHQETIRYKIKRRFGRLGFRFHAEVDFGKIGLDLHWAALDFSKGYYAMAPQILRALNRVGYLTYFAKIVPQGNYVTLFALPDNTADQYKGFLSGLTRKGILNAFTLDEVLVNRHKAMDPRFFNFRSGRWEIEWENVAGQVPTPLPLGKKPRAEDFDYYDLLVIKELQKDSLQHLTGIAKKLKVHQKTLEYHYRTHVQKWKLVPSYTIRWTQDTTRRLVHSVAGTVLTFHGLSRMEFTEVQTAVSKIPFLWSEDLLQGGEYIAYLYAPVTDLINVTSYINGLAPNLSSKVDVGFVKPSDAASFTIPYNMYQGGRWKFDLHQMENALRKEPEVSSKK
jgi:DNA-binding Lrp family transcriptional regulator